MSILRIRDGAVAECKSSAAAFFTPNKADTHQTCGKLLDFLRFWV